MTHVARDCLTALPRPKKSLIPNQSRRESHCKDKKLLLIFTHTFFILGNIKKESRSWRTFCSLAQKIALPSTTSASSSNA